jgi:hypothetical protein
MTPHDLRSTLGASRPPDGLAPLAVALWWDAKGEWSRAHEIAQDISSPEASWVHAYLHRKEGDASNADYWYARAGKAHERRTLESEWSAIANALLTTAAS